MIDIRISSMEYERNMALNCTRMVSGEFLNKNWNTLQTLLEGSSRALLALIGSSSDIVTEITNTTEICVSSAGFFQNMTIVNSKICVGGIFSFNCVT